MTTVAVGWRWRKSSFSSQGGDCVEVTVAGSLSAVRDTKNPGVVLEFERAAVASLVRSISR